MTRTVGALVAILCMCLMISACDGGGRADEAATSEARGGVEVVTQSAARGAAAEATNAACDHTIPSDVDEADGAADFSGVAPGDTVCIAAGTRGPLELRNFHGEDGQTITFVNDGGTVTVRGDGGDYAGIEIEDSDHIRLTGSGSAEQCGADVAADAQKCGIRVFGSERSVTGMVKTEYVRIDHLEMGDNSESAVSIRDNSMGRDEWIEHDVVVEHSYIHDVEDEGVYIGSSDYESGDYHVLHGVRVGHNLVANTGRDGLQIGSATRDCVIHDNVVRHTGLNDESSHRAGVMNNQGSVCDVRGNVVTDAAGWGVYIQGNGGNDVYNNVVVRAGRFVDAGDDDGDGIAVREGSNESGSVRVWNNTIVSSRGDGIGWSSDVGSDNQIRNNLVVGSGGTNIPRSSDVETAHNLVADSVSAAGFVDEAGDDYGLSDGSPAIDAGGDLSAMGITDDIDCVARPQGAAYDVGAHEHQPD